MTPLPTPSPIQDLCGSRARAPRSPAALLVAAALAVSLAGCLPNSFDDLTGGTAKTGAGSASGQGAAAQGGDPNDAAAQVSTFTQFNDIPIPAEADLNLDNSLVLGTEDGWIGRIALDVGYGMTEMYTFYEREMPKFGWEQLTTVRSRISTMTYRRGTRVATITLQSQIAGGTDVDFTVAPANRAVLESSGRSS